MKKDIKELQDELQKLAIQKAGYAHLKGLKNSHKLNGSNVEILEYIKNKGRWKVKLLDGGSGKELLVKTENLNPFSASLLLEQKNKEEREKKRLAEEKRMKEQAAELKRQQEQERIQREQEQKKQEAAKAKQKGKQASPEGQSETSFNQIVWGGIGGVCLLSLTVYLYSTYRKEQGAAGKGDTQEKNRTESEASGEGSMVPPAEVSAASTADGNMPSYHPIEEEVHKSSSSVDIKAGDEKKRPFPSSLIALLVLFSVGLLLLFSRKKKH